MRIGTLRDIRSQTRWLIAVFLAQNALLTAVAEAAQIEELAIRAGFQILSKGNSAADVQAETRAAFPLKMMTPENRQRAVAVVDRCSQFRRLPEVRYAVDPTIYQYLVRHPDVAVSTWRVMGISEFEMWQTGPMDYEAQAVDGSEGLASILYQDNNSCIFLCDGRYHNQLLPKPLEARALVWFRYVFAPLPDGNWLVTQKGDVFIAFPSPGLSAVAKVIAPLTNTMMDRNLYEVSLYASLMSRAVRSEPEWIIQVARQMEGVLPQRSSELISVARQDRSPVPIAGRNRPGEAAVVDRNLLMQSGISLFEPLRHEELAAVPGSPALPGPQVPVAAGINTAGSTSGLTIRAQSEKVLPNPDEDQFVLQPTVIPPTGLTPAGDDNGGTKKPEALMP